MVLVSVFNEGVLDSPPGEKDEIALVFDAEDSSEEEGEEGETLVFDEEDLPPPEEEGVGEGETSLVSTVFETDWFMYNELFK